VSVRDADYAVFLLIDHSPRPSVSLSLSVCPVGNLWKNG